MSAAAIVGGVAAVAAALAFGLRASLLSHHAEGWPSAPWPLRGLLVAVGMLFLLAGAQQLSTGQVPPWLAPVLEVALGAYAVGFCVNLFLQRFGR